MKIIDGLIFHKLEPGTVSMYDQDPELVKQMKSRIAKGICMFLWCPGRLAFDGRCVPHYLESIRPEEPAPDLLEEWEKLPEAARKDAWDELCEKRNSQGLCMYFNCDESLAENKRCVGCNQTYLDLLRLQKENPGYNTGEIMRAYEAEKEGKEKKFCKVVNCNEPIAKENLCGYHYNEYVEEQACKRDPQPSPKQIKEAEAYARELDLEAIESMLDLEWWFERYGETELPAKFINPDFYIQQNWSTVGEGELEAWRVEMAELSKKEAMLLNDKLKELDGSPVNGGTHVWTFTGRKHFKREGQQNHFACLPVDE